MIKLLLASLFILSVSFVTYSQVDALDPAKIKRGAFEYVSPKELKRFPVPPIVFNNARSEHNDLEASLVEKVIYPFLCESEIPIVLITVDFCSNWLKREHKGENACRKNFKGEIYVEVEANRVDGSAIVAWIRTNNNGKFENNAYLSFFTQNYAPKRNCLSEVEK